MTFSILTVVRDLLLGGRHSRRTIAHAGVSLPTADRWIVAIRDGIPWMRIVRIGRTTWIEWMGPPRGRS